MKAEFVEIPTAVLSSVETLDELQDWLTATNPSVVSELLDARKQDLAGKFKPWKPHHGQCAGEPHPSLAGCSLLPHVYAR